MGADAVSAVGLGLGLASAVGVALGWPLAATLGLLLAARTLDGLDGAIARLKAPTARGAFIDIVFDFIAYGAMPLAFAIADPDANALAAAALLFAFYVNGASFLAFAAVAAARGLGEGARGPKGIHYTAGLMEGGETILAFVLMLAFPAAFAPIAAVFALLCLITAGARIALGLRVFGDKSA